MCVYSFCLVISFIIVAVSSEPCKTFLRLTELPWDEPTFSCTEYTAWKDKDCRLFTTTPWTKIDNLALSLLRKVRDSERVRSFVAEIIKSMSFVLDFSDCDFPYSLFLA